MTLTDFVIDMALTAYSRLTAASFQFMFGKIYGSFSAKPVILSSLAIFAVGNLVCALASTSTLFVCGRAVTGLATSGIISGAFALVRLHPTSLV
jgi:predicted MFS family arabinose efflux permease